MSLNTLFAQRTDLAEGSRKHYRYIFKKAVEIFPDADEETFNFSNSQAKIAEVINTADVKNYLKYELFKLAMVFRSSEGRPTNALIANFNKTKKLVEADGKEKLANLDVPDYENYFRENEKFANWYQQKYIVNRLIQLYGLRNQDLDLEMVKQVGKGAKTIDNDDNVMIIKQRSVTLRINKYKTLRTYGTKFLTFTKKDEPVLHKAIETYYKEGYKHLLSKQGGGKEHISIKSIHSHIRTLTGGHGTGTLFKSIVKHHREKGDLTRLTELSKSRGTSMEMISSVYNQQATATDDHQEKQSPPILI